MDRLAAFNKLEQHPWLGKSFNRLTAKDLEVARGLLADTRALDRDEFALFAVRAFMDMRDKPRNWKEIEELFIAANSTPLG